MLPDQKSTKPTHTPGPWKVVSHFTGPLEIYAKDDQLIAMIGSEVFGVAVDNAEFIVRACNAHDDLLAALKQLKARIEELSAVKREGVTGAAYDVMTASIGDDITAEFLEAEEALAKAEGR